MSLKFIILSLCCILKDRVQKRLQSIAPSPDVTEFWTFQDGDFPDWISSFINCRDWLALHKSDDGNKKFVKILLQYLIIVAVTFICIILRAYFFFSLFFRGGVDFKNIHVFPPALNRILNYLLNLMKDSLYLIIFSSHGFLIPPLTRSGALAGEDGS